MREQVDEGRTWAFMAQEWSACSIWSTPERDRVGRVEAEAGVSLLGTREARDVALRGGKARSDKHQHTEYGVYAHTGIDT